MSNFNKVINCLCRALFLAVTATTTTGVRKMMVGIAAAGQKGAAPFVPFLRLLNTDHSGQVS